MKGRLSKLFPPEILVAYDLSTCHLSKVIAAACVDGEDESIEQTIKVNDKDGRKEQMERQGKQTEQTWKVNG